MEKKFRKLFPHLAKEMELGVSRVRKRRINGEPEGEKNTNRKWAKYDPTIVDFIRRCDAEEEVEEIIVYMERRGGITPETAEGLRRQLREEGLRSFGARKEEDYYHKDR